MYRIINICICQRIVLRSCPAVNSDWTCCPWFTVEENGEVVFDLRQEDF